MPAVVFLVIYTAKAGALLDPRTPNITFRALCSINAVGISMLFFIRKNSWVTAAVSHTGPCELKV